MLESFALQLFAFFHAVPAWVYVIVFLAAVLEAMPVFGTLVPGHTIVILSGMLLVQGGLSAWLLVIAAIAGAILGDGVSFVVGRRHGERIFRRAPFALPIIKKSKEFFAKYGTASVIIGRFSAITRSFVPVIAGSSRMKQPTFWTANVIGGILWGASSVLIGFLLGNGYLLVHKHIGAYTFVIVVVAVLFWYSYSRIVKVLLQHPKKALFLLSAVMLTAFTMLFDAIADNDWGTASILSVDAAVRDFAIAHPLYWFWNAVTQFGGPVLLIIVIAAAIFFLRKRRLELFLFCSTVAIGFTLDIVFKAAAGRLRPEQLSGIGNSFPSGHALMATVVYGTLFVILWHDPSWKWKKTLFLLPALILLVAWSRVMIDVHWFSDIVGGLCLGVGVISGVLFLRRFSEQWRAKPGTIKKR